ncbi:MAG: basic amino acid/polyamine antiporter, family [Solirubrobacteraceae bacterium]|jgi:APA family basic amino acid/polyamine antiporter|nr:basic amino acid/polyamine antiporter, family [Solirubrobacteraceae bacterium]
MAAAASGFLGPRKTIDETLASTELEGHKLRRSLGTLDVVVVGVGAMIGAGIFVLTGQAAATEAGPSITLSYVLAGTVCALAALCYAELAAMVPVAGSAYTYTFATLGQLVAFVIGWDLVLEFTIGASAVAVGFAGYLNALLDQVFGVTLPDAITAPPGDGGSVNVFGIGLVVFVGLLLIRGIAMTAKATITFVAITLAVLLLVLVTGVSHVDSGNWSPYFPFGFSGVVGGAALVFFAYIGFDIVATTAEESTNPKRSMPIGILGSLAIVTVIYVAVSGVLTGIAPFKQLNGDAPIADAFKHLHKDWVAAIVYVGALAATLKTVMLLMLGQSRVAFAMSRDRLLPERLGRTHERYGTPHKITLITMVVVAAMAGFVPLSTLAELVNIGTLFAFMLVAAGVLYLRSAEPERERPFRTPGAPAVPVLAILGCIYLAVTLPTATWIRFVVWMVIGLVVYVLYARGSSRVSEDRARANS